jgi:hypothetical protein
MGNSPLMPTQKAPGDVSNFDTEFTKEQPTLTPVHGQLTAKDQMEFNGFSWVRFVYLMASDFAKYGLGRRLGGCRLRYRLMPLGVERRMGPYMIREDQATFLM